MSVFFRWVGFVSAIGIIVLYGWLQHDQIPSHPYGYDESDYMGAARLGTFANAWDTPSRSFWDFVSIGLNTVIYKESKPKASLTQLARAGTDTNILRHTHPPLYYYWLVISLKWASNEEATRIWSQVFPILSILLIFGGCQWIMSGKVGVMAGLLSAALYAFSAAILGTRELTPHLAFGLCTLAVGFCAAKAIQTGSRRHWYAAVVAAGLAFSTLEVALISIFSLAILAWLERNGTLRLRREEIWRSVGIFLITVLATWPAGLLKLSFAKGYLLAGWQATMRSDEWGRATFSETWMHRWISSPVEWACLVAALGLWMAQGSKNRSNPAFPFLLFGGSMLLVMLRVNSETLRYMVPFLPTLHVFAGIMFAQSLDRFIPHWSWAIAGAIILLLGWNAYRFVEQHPAPTDNYLNTVLQSVRDEKLTDKHLLVPQSLVPAMHFYFPRATIEGFKETPIDPPSSFDGILPRDQTRFTLPRQ